MSIQYNKIIIKNTLNAFPVFRKNLQGGILNKI